MKHQIKTINVLLLHPDGHIHLLKLGPIRRSMREAPLTMPILAALAPPELKIEFTVVDESIDAVPLQYDADLVAISVLTGTANRAYQLADHFRSRSIPVVLGGVHVSLFPQEASTHADSVVIGPAEETWPTLLRDFARGELKKEYRGQTSSRDRELILPQPRYDLLRRNGYTVSHTVMATRGCKQSCDFCTIPALGLPYAKRPIADIIRDIRSLPSRLIVFNDVSLADDVEYAKELFTSLIPLGKQWGGLATSKLLEHPDLVEIMSKSGCRYLLIGFESGNQQALLEIHKGFNRIKLYKELIDLLHRHGISVQGTFIFGFDADEDTIFDETVQLVNDLQIDIPRYSILTPYPGTKLFERLQRQDRILTYNWNNYDTMHVVFKPNNMSPHELYKGFKRAYRQTFKIPGILKRLHGMNFQTIINLSGNLNYRRFARKLEEDPRYSKPFMAGTLNNSEQYFKRLSN